VQQPASSTRTPCLNLFFRRPLSLSPPLFFFFFLWLCMFCVCLARCALRAGTAGAAECVARGPRARAHAGPALPDVGGARRADLGPSARLCAAQQVGSSKEKGAGSIRQRRAAQAGCLTARAAAGLCVPREISKQDFMVLRSILVIGFCSAACCCAQKVRQEACAALGAPLGTRGSEQRDARVLPQQAGEAASGVCLAGGLVTFGYLW